MTDNQKMTLQQIASLQTTHNMFKFRGVWFDHDNKKFRASIGGGRKTPRKRLGRFNTAEEAARAYDAAARKLYGDFAYLNFPDESELKIRLSMRHKNLCSLGHDLTEHGYVKNNKGVNCRICNAASQRRRKARIKAKQMRMDP